MIGRRCGERRRARARPVAAISSARATNEENYLLQKLIRVRSAPTTSTTVPDYATRPPPPAWSRPSVWQAERDRSTTSTVPIASCWLGRTRLRRTRSSAPG